MGVDDYHTLYSSRFWQYKCTVTHSEQYTPENDGPYVWCFNNVINSDWAAIAVNIDQCVTEFRFKCPEDYVRFALIWL